jgi:hypothetical protein
MSEVEQDQAVEETYVDETALEFADGHFVTPPYPLRRMFSLPLLDFYLYWGDALRFDRHWLDWSFGQRLCVPPNVGAVVLLANGDRRVLHPGRFRLGGMLLDGKRRALDPVSVQFVNLKVRSVDFSYPFTAFNVKYRDEKEKEKTLTIQVQMSVQVSDPLKITELEDPLEDVKGALKQELIAAFVNHPYDEFYQNRPVLNAEIKEALNRRFAEHHGLTVVDVLLIQMDPADASYIDLSQRGSLVNRNSEIRRREAQMEEDIFALEQPYIMRMAQVTINRLNAERDFEARKLAITSLQQLAQAISDDLHNYPGRYAPGDIEALKQALSLLGTLGGPTRPITFAPLRSLYSKENYPPPAPPPVSAPEAKPPASLSPDFEPPVVPTPEAVERARHLMAPPPAPPPPAPDRK